MMKITESMFCTVNENGLVTLHTEEMEKLFPVELVESVSKDCDTNYTNIVKFVVKDSLEITRLYIMDIAGECYLYVYFKDTLRWKRKNMNIMFMDDFNKLLEGECIV